LVLGALFLVLLAGWAFHGALDCSFVEVDDADLVTENPFVRQGLTRESVRWAFTNLETTQWIPLAWLSLMLDHELYGMEAKGFHRTSVLIHQAATAALFLLLAGTTGLYWPSLMAALLFGVHPLRVESVVWVAERKDVLCALFYILTLAAHARYARRPSWGRYLGVMTGFTLAAMSKAMAMTLPFALLIFDGWPLRRIRTSGSVEGPRAAVPVARAILEKIPLLAMAAGLAVASYIGGQAAVFGSAQPVPYGHSLAVAIRSYFMYLGVTAWPSGLGVQYFYPREAVPVLLTATAVILLAAATLAAWRWRERTPWLAAGWAWYLVTLLPVIGFLQFGRQARADRYTYIPSIGIALAAAFGLHALAQRLRTPRWFFPSAVLAAGLAWAGLTTVQVGYWKDSETLFRRAITLSDRNADAHAWLGLTLSKQGRLEEALPMYRRAISLYPHDAGYFAGLGAVLAQMGSPQEATATLRRALDLDTGNTQALNNLGIVMAQQGEVAEAEALFRKSSGIDPTDPRPLVNLANLALMRQDYEGAARLYRAALQAQPENAQAAAGLNRLLQSGRAR
jgi:Flp pilus assembly protein TadD